VDLTYEAESAGPDDEQGATCDGGLHEQANLDIPIYLQNGGTQAIPKQRSERRGEEKQDGPPQAASRCQTLFLVSKSVHKDQEHSLTPRDHGQKSRTTGGWSSVPHGHSGQAPSSLINRGSRNKRFPGGRFGQACFSGINGEPVEQEALGVPHLLSFLVESARPNGLCCCFCPERLSSKNRVGPLQRELSPGTLVRDEEGAWEQKAPEISYHLSFPVESAWPKGLRRRVSGLREA